MIDVVRSRVVTVLVCGGAAIVGALLAVFTAGVALFADGPMGERLVVFAVSVGAYFAAGVAGGALVPLAWRLVALCLYAPVVAVLAVFGPDVIGQTDMMLLLVGFALGDLAAALAGALLGSRLRSRNRS